MTDLKVECDGCHKEEHVTQEQWDSDSPGAMPTCPCGNFMGWMLVGGRAWHDYHEHGHHPSKALIAEVKEVLAKHYEKN